MSSRRQKAESRVALKQRRYEKHQLYREKRSEEFDALEEVFDKSTLMVIYGMLNRGELKTIYGSLRSGKESKLYWGLGKENQDVAIKIYLTWSAEFRKGRLQYVEGDPRFKSARRDSRSLTFLWARKEFRNLQECRRAGVRVPEPFAVERNVLLMEFIGVEGKPAPLLREKVLENSLDFYGRIVGEVETMFKKAQLVHGDLSEYNIMVSENQPVLIDVSQSVSLEHPMAGLMLKRDLSNLNRYFRSIGVDVIPEDVLQGRVMGKHAD